MFTRFFSRKPKTIDVPLLSSEVEQEAKFNQPERESESEPEPEAEPKIIAVMIPPYGQRIGQLTRFGSTWLDVAKITSVVFQPPDGCGAEVAMEGDYSALHLSDEDAAALNKFFEQTSADVRELERQFGPTQ